MPSPNILVRVLALAGGILSFGFVPVPARDSELTVYAGTVFFDRPEFDSVVLVEFPFTLTRNEFEFFRPDSAGQALFARIFAQVNLYSRDGFPVDSANTYFSATAADPSDAARLGYSLFNSLALVVQPGVYSGRLTVIDAVSKAEGEFFFDRIVVDPPDLQGLALGGEGLAHRLAFVGDQLAVGSGVPRNGYRVHSNPLGVYSTDDTAVFLYAEVYNLDYEADVASEFNLSFAALDESGEIFRQLGSHSRRKAGRSVVVAESFDIGGWSPGSYLLRLTVEDPASRQEVSADLLFRIVAPRSAFTDLPAGAVVDPCDTLGLEVKLRLVYYLLDPDEKRTLKSLSDTGKHSFLQQYWRERDSDPSTEIIENRIEMFERYLYSNGYFSVEEGKTDGWFTDRGRILMVYGPWERMADAVHPASDYPYQLWYYDSIDEGAVFVFQDDHGFGDYRLVHSNVDGEFFSKGWDAALRTGVFDVAD